MFIALIAFLAAFFLPSADGGASIFDSILAMILETWQAAGV
jgi:hypothetical protein